MIKFLCAFTLIAVQLQGIAGQSFAQRAVLYEQLNQGGEYIIIPQTYAPDLSQVC